MDSTGSEQGVLMFHMFYILFIVYVEALQWADPPSRESHGVTNCHCIRIKNETKPTSQYILQFYKQIKV
jgi:hypothetical protein